MTKWKKTKNNFHPLDKFDDFDNIYCQIIQTEEIFSWKLPAYIHGMYMKFQNVNWYCLTFLGKIFYSKRNSNRHLANDPMSTYI